MALTRLGAGAAMAPSERDRQEGLLTLEALVNELGQRGGDVLSITRRARHAYEQLGRHAGAAFFDKELIGFRDNEEVTHYRKVVCRRVWTTGHTYAATHEAMTPDPRLAEKIDSFALRSPLANIVQAAGRGLRYLTGATQTIRYQKSSGREDAIWTESIVVDADVVDNALELFKDLLHHGVGQTLISLRAAREAAPLWDLVRSGADDLATQAGLGDDLRSIAAAAGGDDASAWEGALLRCRNVMDKLSQYLYQAPGETYPHINDQKGRPINVGGGNYKNRLMAYLHQKGMNREDRALMDTHLDWFRGFASDLNDLGSKGHVAVAQGDAANGLLHTYLLLGEIAARTDGLPITEVRAQAAATGVAAGRQQPS